HFHLVVMRLDGMHHIGVLAVLASKISSDNCVRSLNLMCECLADVVQERRTFAVGDIKAKFSRHQCGNVRALNQVFEPVLPIRGAVTQRPQHRDERWMQVGDSDLGHRILGCAQTLCLNLTFTPLMHLLDASGMDSATAAYTGQGHPSVPPPKRIKTESNTASGVSSIMTFTPVTCSNAL